MNRQNLSAAGAVLLDVVVVVGLFTLTAIGKLDAVAAVGYVLAIVAARSRGGDGGDGSGPTVPPSGVVTLLALAGGALASVGRIAVARPA